MAKIANDPLLQSVTRIELLAFFQANPHTRDTADGIALRIHRPRHQVQEALNALCALSILEKGGTERITIYRLRNGESISSYFNSHNNENTTSYYE